MYVRQKKTFNFIKFTKKKLDNKHTNM